MAGLVPAIHVFLSKCSQDVDARHKAGHDELRWNAQFHWLHSGSNAYDISFFKISAKRSRQSFAGIFPRIACWISGTPSESILPPQPG